MALLCPSCEASVPLLLTGPAGLLPRRVRGLPLGFCLCTETQPVGPRCALPPPCSSGAASAMVCPDPGPQPSSLTFRGPVGHSRPSEAGCPPPPVPAWPQAGGLGGHRSHCSSWGRRGRLRRVEGRWGSRQLWNLWFSCRGKGLRALPTGQHAEPRTLLYSTAMLRRWCEHAIVQGLTGQG